jgi:hypothetical protein
MSLKSKKEKDKILNQGIYWKSEISTLCHGQKGSMHGKLQWRLQTLWGWAWDCGAYRHFGAGLGTVALTDTLGLGLGQWRLQTLSGWAWDSGTY